MGCACHGVSRVNAEKIFASEQCRFCGLKHLTTAWSLLTEYGYVDDNLITIDGQLRLAIMHMQYIDKDLCTEIRNIAVSIEKRELGQVTSDRLFTLIKLLQDKIYLKFPDIKQKHEAFLKK